MPHQDGNGTVPAQTAKLKTAATKTKTSAPNKRKKLRKGNNVTSNTAQYDVLKVLGSGGFGDVYLVQNKGGSPDEQYALKTEAKDPKGRKMLDRLKIEMGVFQEINNVKDPDKAAHFVKMIDRGITEDFKFIVMGLVSYSIESIRKEVMKRPLEWPTVIKVAMQTLDAIRDLHAMGYIHRDIKPHNFAIGRPPKEDVIYMLDFGIVRKYADPSGKLKIPREAVKFLGTVKFASRECHRRHEQSRKDDIEVWCYMIIDLLDTKNLTWRYSIDRDQVLKDKEKLFQIPIKFAGKTPDGVNKILEEVDKMSYTSVPNYELLAQMLQEVGTKMDMSKPFEWIGKTAEKQKKKKKYENQVQDDEHDNTDERKKREKKKTERRERKARGEKKKTEEDEDEEEEDDSEDQSAEGGKKKSSKKNKSRDSTGQLRKSTSRRKSTKTRTKTKDARSKESTADKIPSSSKGKPSSSVSGKSPTAKELKLISIDPPEIKWEDKQVDFPIMVDNLSDSRLAVKTRGSNNAIYLINPSLAFIAVGEGLRITISRTKVCDQMHKICILAVKCSALETDPAAAVKKNTESGGHTIDIPIFVPPPTPTTPHEGASPQTP